MNAFPPEIPTPPVPAVIRAFLVSFTFSSIRPWGRLFTLLLALGVLPLLGHTQNLPSSSPATEVFELGPQTSIFVDPTEKRWVQHAARDLQTDIRELTRLNLPLVDSLQNATRDVIAIGARGTPWVDDLLQRAIVTKQDFDGHESSVIRTLPSPWGLDPVQSVLLIVGDDSRGTMYGVYTFAEEHLGVDPLKFWTGYRPPPSNR